MTPQPIEEVVEAVPKFRYAGKALARDEVVVTLHSFKEALATRDAQHEERMRRAQEEWQRELIETLDAMKEPHRGHINYHTTDGYNQALQNVAARYLPPTIEARVDRAMNQIGRAVDRLADEPPTP